MIETPCLEKPCSEFCEFLKRKMKGRRVEICNGTSGLPLEKRDAYIRNWQGQKPAPPTVKRSTKAEPYDQEKMWQRELPCIHRGERLRTDKCNTGCAGGRGKPVEVYKCEKKSECTLLSKIRKTANCQHCAARDPGYTVAGDLAAAGAQKWAVAVTTAPRDGATLPRCLDSLVAAGWLPIVFAEPGSVVPPGVPVVWNQQRLGAWRNWLQSMHYLLRETLATHLLTVQDDTVVHPDSRELLETAVNWDHESLGFVSLYTPKHYSKSRHRRKGIHRIRTGSLWGACALAYPRRVAEDMVDTQVAETWNGVSFRKRTRPRDPWEVANVDTAIGRMMNELDRDMLFVTPSAAQHIAEHSTIGHGGNKGRRNCEPCADHSKPLAEQVGV